MLEFVITNNLIFLFRSPRSTRFPFVFHLIIKTDEDSEYPSSELNSHGPAVVGWRSKADSTLEPKEIILRFDKPAIVCRIQVLAHQFMIREFQHFCSFRWLAFESASLMTDNESNQLSW